MVNRLIAALVPYMPERFVWLFSKRYIAGKTLDDAVKISQTLNGRGISVTVDVLGEYIKEKAEAEAYKQQYLMTIGQIQLNNLKATISVKPTMFGLLIDPEFCHQQIKEVLTRATEARVKVCMDMEDSGCTDRELALFENLYNEFPETISLVLQAYLKRTLDDLKRLSKMNKKEFPIDVRICKGIYIEPAAIAFKHKEDVNTNYINCLNFMFENNFFCSIATHDISLVSRALASIVRYNISRNRYEFQMLYGVRPELRDRLVKEGHPMRVYIPYGEHWFGYSTRRLKENPRMVSHIIKALFTGG